MSPTHSCSTLDDIRDYLWRRQTSSNSTDTMYQQCSQRKCSRLTHCSDTSTFPRQSTPHCKVEATFWIWTSHVPMHSLKITIQILNQSGQMKVGNLSFNDRVLLSMCPVELFADGDDFSWVTIQKGRNRYYQKKAVRASERDFIIESHAIAVVGRNHQSAGGWNKIIGSYCVENSQEYQTNDGNQYRICFFPHGNSISRIPGEQEHRTSRRCRDSSTVEFQTAKPWSDPLSVSTGRLRLNRTNVRLIE